MEYLSVYRETTSRFSSYQVKVVNLGGQRLCCHGFANCVERYRYCELVNNYSTWETSKHVDYFGTYED